MFFWHNLDYQWCTMLFSNRVVLYIIWNLTRWYSKLVNMNRRCIRKDDFSKWLKVCRNTKKESFTNDNVSIVKKRHKKRLGMWKCRCAKHSEVWMWRMHQCTFTEDSQLHDIRLLSEPMILASIIESYIFTWVGYLHGPFFWHPFSDIFNTWENFIWISILSSFFRLPESRH